MEIDHETAFQETFKAIFNGRKCPFTLEEAAKKFSYNISIPKEVKPSMGKELVYCSYPVKRMVSLKEMEAKYSDDEFIYPKKEKIKSVDDIVKLAKYISIFAGNKFLNCQDGMKSDNYYHSSYVYLSNHVESSKYIGFSTHIDKCEYVYGSRDLSSSTLSLRCQDSNFLNTCFETSWSSKSSNCYFCHGNVNVRHCIFCFHIASRQYCIANRQYSKEEYEAIREMLFNELFGKKFKIDFFPKF